MVQEKTQNCSIHGQTVFVYRTDGRWRCRECNTAWVRNRRKRMKAKAVEYKGGKCFRCGYDKSLAAIEFHHNDPENKSFGLSFKGSTILGAV